MTFKIVGLNINGPYTLKIVTTIAVKIKHFLDTCSETVLFLLQEDQKIERLNKRANDLERAKSACRVLSDILTYSAGEPLSTHEADLVQVLFC